MIEGLHIDVTSAELKTLLTGRLHHHEEKVSVYEKQIAQLAQVNATLDAEAMEISKTSNATPMRSLEDARKRHQDQCVYYRFMAAHVVADEVYRLSEHDLERLGISTRNY